MLTIYLMIGIVAGILSGLFGVGGGVIVIPALSHVFRHDATIPSASIMQMAVGTSLAIMIFTATSALYAHQKRKGVRWQVVKVMLPGLMLGSVGGAIIAHYLPSSWLRIIFGLFLVFIGLQMIINKQPKPQDKNHSLLFLRLSSFFIGTLSSLLGVGGGSLLVPFFLSHQLDMREATGTSIACGLAVGVVATISFMAAGYFAGSHIPDSTGYIYWPAFVGVVIASVLLAPLGAILAHKLPKEFLKKIFGWFLLLMACDMLFFK